MIASDYLLALAQLGLVTAGFISLIDYLYSKKHDPKSIQAIRFILNHSIALVIFSLLPFPLYYCKELTVQCWVISNISFSIYLLYSSVTTSIKVFKIIPSKFYTILFLHIAPSLIFSVLLIIFNNTVAYYLATLLWLFISVLTQFRISLFNHLKRSAI